MSGYSSLRLTPLTSTLDQPCLTYGLVSTSFLVSVTSIQNASQRGICYFEIIVHGPSRDLHSGVFGGTVHEPMTDLIQLMSKLVTSSGEILIPGVMDSVAPLTEKEKYVFPSIWVVFFLTELVALERCMSN